MAIKKKYLVTTGIILSLIIIAALLTTTFSVEKTIKYYKVKKGKFEAVLNCKGEISGLIATEIRAPKILGDRDLRLWSMKILDLAQDGENVKKGDFIIQLDASQIISGMQEEQQRLEKEVADLNNAKIDSTVTLTQMREEIKNALLDLEYNKIDLEQSIYESAAYQRKAQLTFQKAENDIAKKRRDYQLEQNKLKTRVSRAAENVERLNIRIGKFQEAIKAARITAPEDGIVIFGKSWEGKKYSKDDDVSTHMYAPAIATLPDMSKVISEVYVKEIDISKIKVGDRVNVSFDALEETIITGFIKTIARVGEDHKGFDMKVFKVVIYLDESNEELKPSMTSSNDIILVSDDKAIFVPLNSVFKKNGTKYLYLKTKDGVKKQIITTGLDNEEFIIVKNGINEGDLVLLESPTNNNLLTEKRF